MIFVDDLLLSANDSLLSGRLLGIQCLDFFKGQFRILGHLFIRHSICGTCLRHFVDAKAFKIALVPSADRSMDTCTVCQMRRGYDYVVMHR